MTPPSVPPPPMRFLRSGLTLATGMLVLAGVLFALSLYYSEAEFRTWSRYGDLRDSIIAASPVKADSFSVTHRAEAEALAVSNSPRAAELRTLQARERRQNLTALSLGIAALVALGASLVFAGHFMRRYWRGEGVPPAELEVRRASLQARASVALTTVLVGLAVFWRYLAGTRRDLLRRGFAPHEIGIQGYLVTLSAVLVCAVLLVWLVWRVLSSPNSRVSQDVSKAPKLYRTSVQSVLVWVTTLVAAGDLSGISNTGFLVLQMAGWLGMAVALSSVLLAYLTPRRLVTETGVSAPGVTIVEPMEPESVDAAGGNGAGDADGEGGRKRIGVSPWPREVRQDLARIAAQVQEVSARMDQAARSAARPATADEALRLQANRMRERLQEEVHSLTTRGNLNLSIGIVTTLLAVGMLWWLVLDPPPSPGTNAELISHFVPRLSVAVFIEVFSFFFLRLYRNGLADIKYYQNEMTTIESRILALEVAVMSARPEPVDEILRGLSSMDRNMVLRQGESTIELERLKIEQQNLRTVVDGVAARIPVPSSTPQGTGSGAAVG